MGFKYEITIYTRDGASEVFRSDDRSDIQSWLYRNWPDALNLSAMIRHLRNIVIRRNLLGRRRLVWKKG